MASIDLQRHRGAALVGSDRFTAALARTMLVELTTQHGPADLDIAIASTPDHIGQWNWAKWLPHVREAGPASPPELFDNASALAAWAAGVFDASESDPGTRPVTLLVLDDISLWSQRDSPIRRLLVSPPRELRIIALCVGLHEAPGLCTSLVEEVPPIERLAHLTAATASTGVGRPALFGSTATQHTRTAEAPQVVSDIHPALTEVPFAAEVARNLAPLDDLDAEYQSFAPKVVPPDTQRAGGSRRAARPRRRPDDPVAPLNVPIGVLSPFPAKSPASRTAVNVDLTAPRSTIVVADEGVRHDLTVADAAARCRLSTSP